MNPQHELKFPGIHGHHPGPNREEEIRRAIMAAISPAKIAETIAGLPPEARARIEALRREPTVVLTVKIIRPRK